MKRFGYIVLAFLFLSTTAQAQFLKKLGDKIADKVEETATDNISNKAGNETDETLNEPWETDLSKENEVKNNSKRKKSSSDFPESYDFDWKYSLHLDLNESAMDFVYRLEKGANYMGMGGSMMSGMFIVMDFYRELSIMFMNGFVKGTKLDMSNASDIDNRAMQNMTFEKIGSKTILGYQCEGYRAESDEYLMTMYVTNEAGIGFVGIYKNQKYFPKGFGPDWVTENSLMMEMQMVDKKNSKKSMTMTCTEIERENFTISK